MKIIKKLKEKSMKGVLVVSILFIIYFLGELESGFSLLRTILLILGMGGIFLYRKEILVFFRELKEMDTE